MAVFAPRADADGAVAPASAGAAAYRIRLHDSERAVLRVDFASPDRSALVTTLLEAFLIGADGDPLDTIELWNWPVSARHLALVRIAAAIDAIEALPVPLECPQPDCREQLEVPLAVGALIELHERHATHPTVALPTTLRCTRLRRPTGTDLQRWFAAAANAGAASDPTMLHDLVVEGEPPVDLAAAEAALESFDPLLAFSMEVMCPACRRPVDHPVDLEDLALTRLQRHQTRLLREFHRLARAYGWTEPQILAVPAARRAKYLELIAQEGRG